MKKSLLITLPLLWIVSVKAQPNRQYETNPDRMRTNKWLFGINGNSMEFYSDSQSYINKMSSNEASAIFTSVNGRVIIYSNGETIWDSSNRVLINGLSGNHSSRLGAVFCYNSYTNDLALFYSNHALSTYKELFYSKFKLSDSGLIITDKNIKIMDQICEPLALTYAEDKYGFWVICHGYNSNIFYSYRITDGVIRCPVVSITGNMNGGSDTRAAQINLKLSNDGKYLMKSNRNNPLLDGVQIFTFDNESGIIKLLFSIPSLKYPVLGVAFSPNSKNIYIIERDGDLKLYKFYPNDSLSTISSMKSMTNIYDQAFEIQNGLDDKLYFSIYDSIFLACVDSPDNYSDFSVTLNGKKLAKPIDNTGLPNFNQSYFYTPSIDFAYNYDCVNNIITFKGRDTFYATSHNWQIRKSGMPAEGIYTTKNIKHSFLDTGSYYVQYSAVNGNMSDTVNKYITIYPKISKNFLGKDTAFETGTNFTKTLWAPIGMHCYYWLNDSSGSNTFNADSAGTYICKITSQSFCEVWDTIVISNCINDLVSPTLKRSRDTLLVSHFLADSFVWFRNNVLYKVSKKPFLALIDTGSYRVEAAKKGHCSKSSDIYKVQKLNILSPFLLYDPVYIYPNPASEQITIEFAAQGTYSIQLYNSLGQLVHSKVTSGNTNLNLNGLPAGVYLIAISNPENQLYYYKLIKE